MINGAECRVAGRSGPRQGLSRDRPARTTTAITKSHKKSKNT
jgi:hypothetical protein